MFINCQSFDSLTASGSVLFFIRSWPDFLKLVTDELDFFCFLKLLKEETDFLSFLTLLKKEINLLSPELEVADVLNELVESFTSTS